MKKQKKQLNKMPQFMSEDEEATWWASAEGSEFLKQQSAARTLENQKGSPLVANLSRTSSVQIALRLPAPDVAKAGTDGGSLLHAIHGSSRGLRDLA